MPVGAAVGAFAVGGIVSGYGAGKAADATTNAANLQSQDAGKALAYTEQKDNQERADTIAAQQANYAQWAASAKDSYARYAAKETNLQPYRALGLGAGATLSHLLGVTPGTPAPVAPMQPLPPPPTYTTVPPPPPARS